MKTLSYVIHAVPATKKNSQQIVVNRKTGRPFVMPSETYKQFEMEAGYFLRPKPKEAVSEAVNVQYRFYMPTRRRVDLANLISAMDDVLVHWKILADDNRDIIGGHDGCRVFHDKDDPRVEVIITPMAQTYRQWKEAKT